MILKFDCTLQERATFEELMGALNTDSQLFQLQITKLDLLCLGKSNIIKLLSKLDKNVTIYFLKIKLKKKLNFFNKSLSKESACSTIH